jgi:hypothetical protein
MKHLSKKEDPSKIDLDELVQGSFSLDSLMGDLNVLGGYTKGIYTMVKAEYDRKKMLKKKTKRVKKF